MFFLSRLIFILYNHSVFKNYSFLFFAVLTQVWPQQNICTFNTLQFYIRIWWGYESPISVFSQIRLWDVLPCCAADLSNHTEVSLRPWAQRPGLDTSVQSAWVSLKYEFSFLLYPLYVLLYVSTFKKKSKLNRAYFALLYLQTPELCPCGTPVFRLQSPAQW